MKRGFFFEPSSLLASLAAADAKERIDVATKGAYEGLTAARSIFSVFVTATSQKVKRDETHEKERER